MVDHKVLYHIYKYIQRWLRDTLVMTYTPAKQHCKFQSSQAKASDIAYLLLKQTSLLERNEEFENNPWFPRSKRITRHYDINDKLKELMKGVLISSIAAIEDGGIWFSQVTMARKKRATK